MLIVLSIRKHKKIKKDTAQGEKQEEIVAKAEVKAEVAEAN